jgi:uncharacterized protein
MADELLEEFIRQYIAGQEVGEVVFNWHGGEPALLGLDFFRRVVELQQKYAGRTRVANDFQTNGVLLDEAWCEFFKEHGFYVGLSIDGPKDLHDRFRVGKGGAPTFDHVYRAARLLREYDVPFSTLTVVHAVNSRHPAEVYRFLTEDLGCARLQWLPCAEPKDFRTVAPGQWDTTRMPVLGTPAARPGHPDSVVTDWSASDRDALAGVVQQIAESDITLEDPTTLAAKEPGIGSALMRVGTAMIRNDREVAKRVFRGFEIVRE